MVVMTSWQGNNRKQRFESVERMRYMIGQAIYIDDINAACDNIINDKAINITLTQMPAK